MSVAELAAHRAALAACAEALRENTAAQNRCAAAHESLARAVRGNTAALEARPAQMAAVPGPRTAEVAASADGVACPPVLERLRDCVGGALRDGAAPAGEAILGAAGMGGTTAAWVRLRAVLAVCFAGQATRVQGHDLGPPRPSGAEAVAVWLRQQQMVSLRVSGMGAPATILNHVSRRLHADATLRQRHGERLLRDAAGL
jgi:hypothetical protein